MAGARLQDVAEKAGVSLATASLALSGKGRISDEVRARVRETAGRLGYAARAASGARRPAGPACIGILHYGDHAYEWGFIRPTLFELQNAVLLRGYLPVLIPVDQKTGFEHALRLITSQEVPAVFSIHYGNEPLFSELEKRGVSVVVVNNSTYQDRFFSVCVDDFQGAYEGAAYLVSLGHRDIAFIEYERPESPAVVADRFVGFRKALDEKGIPFAPEQRITIPFMDRERLARRLSTLFGRAARPTAVFAHDDYLGMFVIEALRGIGLSVPADVSLLAPGDVLDYGLPFTPQITTMRINTSLLGRIAADLLLERMKRHHEGVHVLKVKEQLVRRETCRAINGSRGEAK
jgi:LacI family transcriptional regulator